MASAPPFQDIGPLGGATTPAPGWLHWIIGGALALAIHMAVSAPFVEEAVPPPTVLVTPEAPGIAVNLAPVIQPPEAPPPETPPEPEQETPKIEERSKAAPPPAPPPVPRKVPKLPDIKPKAVPDLWMGSGSGEGQLSLDEYLLLRGWLKQARAAVLSQLVYPSDARKRMAMGTAKIVVSANAKGRITGWDFQQKTGDISLNRAVKKAVESVRKLPKFPDGTQYQELSYIVTIRFELVMDDGTILTKENAPQQIAQAAPQQTANTMSIDTMRSCAASSATLGLEHSNVLALRAELESLREDYEIKANRYARHGEQLPITVERILKTYKKKAEGFDDRIVNLQQRVDAYRALCGSGSTTFNDYAKACWPYKDVGNDYCEAYSSFWAQLQVTQ